MKCHIHHKEILHYHRIHPYKDRLAELNSFLYFFVQNIQHNPMMSVHYNFSMNNGINHKHHSLHQNILRLFNKILKMVWVGGDGDRDRGKGEGDKRKGKGERGKGEGGSGKGEGAINLR
jgi:hypothetical protein